MKILPAIVVVFMLLMAVVSNGVIAQSPTPEPTVLGPGDAIIIGFNTTVGNDEIAILLLKDISSNTELQITDFGWDNTKTTPSFKTLDGDGIFSWKDTVNSYKKGEVINILHTYGESGFNIKNNSFGDQIFLLQGNYVSDPKLIFGVNVNYSTWQNTIVPTEYTSGLPLLLVGNNFYLTSRNAKYIGKTSFPDADSAKLEIMNSQNWQGNNTTPENLEFPDFTIGTTVVSLQEFLVKKSESNIFLWIPIITLGLYFFFQSSIKKLGKRLQIND